MSVEEMNIGKAFVRKSDRSIWRVAGITDVLKGTEEKAFAVHSYRMENDVGKSLIVPVVSLPTLFMRMS